MRREVELPTGIAIINSTNTGASIQVDGFKATVRELEVLDMRSQGLKPDQIDSALGLKPSISYHHLQSLIARNSDAFSGANCSVGDITKTAIEHELLGEIPIAGINAIVSTMKSTNVSEHLPVVPSTSSTQEGSNNPTHDPNQLSFKHDVVGNEDFLRFATKELNGWFKFQKEYSEENALRFRQLVMSLLQDGVVSKPDIMQAGFIPGRVVRKAFNMALNYRETRIVSRKETRKLMRSGA